MRDRMNEVAARLRIGQADAEVTKLAQEALEGLRAAGREFNEKDKARLREIAKQLPPEAAPRFEPKVDPKDERNEAPKGRVREKLTGGREAGMGRVRGEAGEMPEDQLRRFIEAGQAKVAPEYRKPVEEYYKAVSK